MATESKVSFEIPLTDDQKKISRKTWRFCFISGKKNTQERNFNTRGGRIHFKKISIEKKLMAGEYKSLFDMATDINDGKPTKEIESIIFKNMMKIMLNEFSA